MKKLIFLLLIVSITVNLHSQTIEQQILELGVLQEKNVFEWKKKDDLALDAPYVVINTRAKPDRNKYLDPNKVIRIEKFDDDLANHLFGDKAKNGAYKLITKEDKNGVFKVVSNPAFHSSCKLEEHKKAKEACTKKWLDDQLKKLVKDQDDFVLELNLNINGEIVDVSIRKGETNKSLERLFKQWKKKKYDWYPAMQRNNFVSFYHYYRHKKK